LPSAGGMVTRVVGAAERALESPPIEGRVLRGGGGLMAVPLTMWSSECWNVRFGGFREARLNGSKDPNKTCCTTGNLPRT